jgi:hypothetical protein
MTAESPPDRFDALHQIALDVMGVLEKHNIENSGEAVYVCSLVLQFIIATGESHAVRKEMTDGLLTKVLPRMLQRAVDKPYGGPGVKH